MIGEGVCPSMYKVRIGEYFAKVFNVLQFLHMLVSWKKPIEEMLWMFNNISKFGMPICSMLTFRVM